jgi:protein O-GlcNAc transferase
MKNRRRPPIPGPQRGRGYPCGSGRAIDLCCKTPELARAMAAAVAAHQANQLDAALAAYSGILDRAPGHADALHYSGVIHFQQGDLPQARALIERAVALRPGIAAYYANLGNVLKRLGEKDAALSAFERSLALETSQPVIQFNYVLLELGRSAEAARTLRQVVARRPDWAPGWCELGNALLEEEAIDDAVAAYRRALELDPRLGVAHQKLGATVVRFGDVAGSISSFEAARRIDPDDERACTGRLFALGLSAEHGGPEILAEHLEWQSRFGDRVQRIALPLRVPGERLRIAYLSGDFRRHAMRFFVRPILRHHDRRRFFVTAYSTPGFPDDDVTAELRPQVDNWVDCRKLDGDELARRIAADRIDILVDLAGHAGGSRMLALAAHPAHFQCTMLGYMTTTGARAMDARIADAVAIPPDAESWFSERILRLPHSQWCYAPDAVTPPVGELPALQNGCLTYGSFHSVAKINARVIELWIGLLRSQPGARLLLVAWGDAAKRYLRKPFARAGLESRVDVLDPLPYERYLELYHRIDVSLDVFPYSGGTVNCESLWMGVPVLTLAHDSPAGRGGASIMAAAGLPGWVAHSGEDLIARAGELTSDRKALAALRAELRKRLQCSPLMDAPRYVADLEALLGAQLA